MALISCYECGKEISDKAPTCIHCGAPQRSSSQKKFLNNFANLKPSVKKILGDKAPVKILVVLAPLVLISGVRLNQSGWNMDALAWRLRNSKFIEQKCKVYGSNTKKVRNECRSMIYKLGAKAENITGTTYSYCNRKLNKDLDRNPRRIINYENCVEEKIRQDEYRQRMYRQKMRRQEEQSRIDQKKRKRRRKNIEKALEIFTKELNRPAPPPPKIHIIRPPERRFPRQIQCQQYWMGRQLQTNCNQY